MANQIMRFFAAGHLKAGKAKEVSEEVCDLAEWINDEVPDGPEKSAGLRKLLEAKDCFVRASLSAE